MAKALATSFKLRLRSLPRSCPASLKAIIGKDCGFHMLTILAPVGGRVQYTTRGDFAPEKGNKVRLDNAPFVVPFFRPWIGKQQVYRLQRPVRELVLQNLYGIVANDAHVFKVLDAEQAMTNAGLVNLDANKVLIRIVRRGG